MAEKQQKIFLTLDFDNSYLSNQGYFCFLLFFLFSSACWALSEEGIVGKRMPLPHNPRFVLSKTSCCFAENDVLFC